MSNRTTSIDDYLKYTQNEEYPAYIGQDHHGYRSEIFIKWLETFTSGPFMITLKYVYFCCEEDRTFFYLGFSENRQ